MSGNVSMFYNDVVIDGHIISRSFPGALNMFSSGLNNIDFTEPYVIFDNKIHGDLDTGVWEVKLTGGATTTYLTDQSSLLLTAPNSGKVVVQSRKYVPYQPGRIQKIIMTAVLRGPTVPAGGYVSRIGSFDDNVDKTPVSNEDRGGDGHFFEYNGTDVYVTQRKTTNIGPGFQTDDKVAKDSWNMDPLDGTGPSEINISASDIASNSCLFFITRIWLGSGDVILGIYFNNFSIACHRFNNTLAVDGVYMKRASLPIRYEISNSGATDATMKQICSSVSSMGGYTPRFRTFFTERLDFVQGSSGVNTHGLSIRLKASRNRHTVIPERLFYHAPSAGDNEAVKYSFSLGATLSVGLTFSSLSSNSAIEVATNTANVTVLGEILAQGLILGRTNAQFDYDFENAIALTSTILGTSRILTLSITTLAGSNINDSSVIFSWREFS